MTGHLASQRRGFPAMLIFAVLLLSLLAGRARATTVENSEHHYSYSLPRGWTDFDDDKLQKINSSKSQNYLNGGKNSDGAYFLVKADNGPLTSGGGSREMARFRQELEAPGVTVESLKWDSRRNAYVARLGLETGGSTTHCITYTFVGPSERINFFCYPSGTDISPYAGDFDTLADSFEFQDAGGGASGPSARPGRSGSGSSMGTWIVGGLGCGVCSLTVVIIGVVILVAVLRKRKAAR